MAGWRGFGRRGLAGVLSLVLAVKVAPVDGAFGAPGPSPVPPQAADAPVKELPTGSDGLVALSGVVSRPDWMSASVTARAQVR